MARPYRTFAQQMAFEKKRDALIRKHKPFRIMQDLVGGERPAFRIGYYSPNASPTEYPLNWVDCFIGTRKEAQAECKRLARLWALGVLDRPWH